MTFGSILVLTLASSSVMVMLPFSFSFDAVIEVSLSTLASADTEDVDCLFDLVLVAARILCSMDDRKRLNVLSWTSGLTGGSEVLDEVDMELSLGSRSRAVLKGLETASCVRRWRTVDVMYVGRPGKCGCREKGKLRQPTRRKDEQDQNLRSIGRKGQGQSSRCEMRPNAVLVHSEHETHSDYGTGGSCVTLLHGYKAT